MSLSAITLPSAVQHHTPQKPFRTRTAAQGSRGVELVNAKVNIGMQCNREWDQAYLMFDYPTNDFNGAMLQALCRYGLDFEVVWSSCKTTSPYVGYDVIILKKQERWNSKSSISIMEGHAAS